MGYCRICTNCCVLLFAMGVGLCYLEPVHRIGPLYAGNLNVHEPEFKEFVLKTQQTLRSKRVVSPPLVHEATANEWLQGGIILDIGVFLGSSTRILSGLLGNRTMVHGFDTFSGFPEGDWFIDDFVYPSNFSHDEPWVQGLIQEHGLTFKDGKPSTQGFNITYHKGMTFDTLQPVLDASPGVPVKFMHIDIDTYEGALHALETCRPRMVPGTVIVFDDFFVMSGEFKALWNFTKHHPSFKYTWRSWGNDIGWMNIINLKSLYYWVSHYSLTKFKLTQLIVGFRFSVSWADYLISLLSYTNNAVSLHVTDPGKP